jgi:hypothetical protein
LKCDPKKEKMPQKAACISSLIKSYLQAKVYPFFFQKARKFYKKSKYNSKTALAGARTVLKR